MSSAAVTVNMDQNDQIKLARSLVNPNKQTRDNTFESLRLFLASASSINDLEMLKFWKALYYCMWLTDKAAIQLEVATFLCDLMDSIPKKKTVALYMRMFLRTILREWPLLDQHRLDKFYMLIRLMIRKMFSYLRDRDYPQKLTQHFLDELSSEVLTKTPNGVRFHIIDVYLQELSQVTEGDIQNGQFITLVQPFLDLLSVTRDDALIERIGKKIFNAVLSTYCVESAVDKQSDGLEESDVEHIFSNVNVSSVQLALFNTASDQKTSDHNRPKIYALHKQYSIQTGKAFVTAESIELDASMPRRKKAKREVSAATETLTNGNSINNNNSNSNTTNTKKRNLEYIENHANSIDNAHIADSGTKKRVKVKGKIIEPSAGHVPSPSAATTADCDDSDHPAVTTKQASAKQSSTPVSSKTKFASSTSSSITPTMVTHSSGAAASEGGGGGAEEAPAEFIASSKFQGARIGYFFSKGRNGVGYYADHSRHPAKTHTKVQSQQKEKKTAQSVSQNTTSPSSARKHTDSGGVGGGGNIASIQKEKRRVSFGKPQAKDYKSSVKALQTSSPAKIMTETPHPRSALKKMTAAALARKSSSPKSS